jgi:hypothetical protein
MKCKLAAKKKELQAKEEKEAIRTCLTAQKDRQEAMRVDNTRAEAKATVPAVVPPKVSKPLPPIPKPKVPEKPATPPVPAKPEAFVPVKSKSKIKREKREAKLVKGKEKEEKPESIQRGQALVTTKNDPNVAVFTIGGDAAADQRDYHKHGVFWGNALITTFHGSPGGPMDTADWVQGQNTQRAAVKSLRTVLANEEDDWIVTDRPTGAIGKLKVRTPVIGEACYLLAVDVEAEGPSRLVQQRGVVRSLEKEGRVLRHTCSTHGDGGQSGAPIFAESDGACIGIHRGGHKKGVQVTDVPNWGVVLNTPLIVDAISRAKTKN